MKFAIIAALVVAICHVSAVSTMSVSLLSKLRTEGTADVMLVLRDEVEPLVNSINSRRFTTSAIKTTAMVQELKSFTKKSQQSILNFLEKRTATGVKSFWITNRIFVPAATLELVERLSINFADEIVEIREQIIAHLDYTVDGADASPRALEWGVDNIRAPEVWADGVEGEGILVSHIDTGVRVSHEAFAGALADSHNWLDPYTSSSSPVDENGHGTHTMGSIVGRGGTGVAPKSKFITCRGCDTASCTEAALLACGQWTTCPTQPDGSDADCTKKPALSSNSWGGGQESAWYNDVINAWKAADIVPVFAIGNSGPGCRTANSPGDQVGVISVGATTNTNAVASFSSHGPTLFTSRIKPEVSAPGQNVRSASHTSDNGYVALSGTSMATPHVAGAVALLLSKDNSLTFSQIDTLLKENNVRPRLEQVICTGGGVNITNPWPNNSFGHGKIDVKQAADQVSAH